MRIFVTNSPITNPEPAPEPVAMTLHLTDGEVPMGWADQGITGPGVFDLPDPAPAFSAPEPEPEEG